MLFELMVKIGRDLLEDARRILVRQKTLDYSHIEDWLGKYSRALDADYLKLFKSLR